MSIRYDRMDALDVLHHLRRGGATVTVCRDGALELREEIREELHGPGSGGFCPACCGRVFYRHDSRWHCLGCDGLPAAVPDTFALTAAVDL